MEVKRLRNNILEKNDKSIIKINDHGNMVYFIALEDFGLKGSFKLIERQKNVSEKIVFSFEGKAPSTPSDKRVVDLGLSVKWASCNVGATEPEEYGDYFAWGETEPYYTEGHSQDNPCKNWKPGKTYGYEWASYKWCKGTYDTMTKYCKHSSYGTVTVDNKTTLDLSDDAARANWGGSWRMPTKAEQDELRTKCTWEWRTLNGKKGYKVTGPNGNFIFLPAAGDRLGSSLRNAGSGGFYWSSSLDTIYSQLAYLLFIDINSDHVDWTAYDRSEGHSVRAVCP